MQVGTGEMMLWADGYAEYKTMCLVQRSTDLSSRCDRRMNTGLDGKLIGHRAGFIIRCLFCRAVLFRQAREGSDSNNAIRDDNLLRVSRPTKHCPQQRARPRPRYGAVQEEHGRCRVLVRLQDVDVWGNRWAGPRRLSLFAGVFVPGGAMSDYPLRGSGFISQRGENAECPVCSEVVSRRRAAATEPCGGAADVCGQEGTSITHAASLRNFECHRPKICRLRPGKEKTGTS
ncbi:hypothetical protein F4802DRAFT_105273 [Xylaria palmicola]|nr:hypothetical protein F4802DRAFT_105273 [Xylaria palmicola]